VSEATVHLGLLEESLDGFRLHPEEPVTAYWALTLRGDRAVLSLHVHNLRPLQSGDPFVYQGWLVPAEGDAVALAPFSPSLEGVGFCTMEREYPAVAHGPGAYLMVTAEPRQPDPEQPAPALLRGAWADLAPPVPEAAAPEPPEPAEEPARDLFLRQDEPATPVSALPPLQQTQEMLSPVHPLARSGSGVAILDFTHDGVVLTLSDAPGPEVYGSDPMTGRNFNVYAGWLMRRADGDIAPLGFFRKVWQGTYRLQARGAAPLTDYDTLLVSAEDRAGAFDPVSRKAFATPYGVPMVRSPSAV